MIDLSKGSITFVRDIREDYPIAELAMQSADSMIDCYEELLAKAIIERAKLRDSSISEDHQEKVFPYIKHIIEWLRSGDFYTSPASTRYHDAYHCGLLKHTLEVYNQLVGLRSVPKFKEVVEKQWYSAVFVVLVHDWCKIGRYESYWKNVQDSNGEWTKVSAYKYKEDGVGRLGHGTQSLIVAMQLCNSKLTSLTFEEMTSIRWHMDNWDVTKYEAEDLYRCNSQIPMVRMVQFADQLAITEY